MASRKRHLWDTENCQVYETRRVLWSDDETRWPDDARYRLRGFAGVAWRALGWECEPDADTEWTGQVNRTGAVVCIMVGDDAPHAIDPTDLEPIGDTDYCAVCGQIGCTHDGRDRSETE